MEGELIKMNYILIEGIVDTLVNTNLMFDEGIKKAWFYNMQLKNAYPNEKEIAIIGVHLVNCGQRHTINQPKMRNTPLLKVFLKKKR